jgi:hypothetical protein
MKLIFTGLIEWNDREFDNQFHGGDKPGVCLNTSGPRYWTGKFG